MAFGIDFRGDGLRSRSIRSSLLTGFSFGMANILRLGGNLILTRLLFPEAFGIMALVQVVMTGLSMFSDIGIRASIIQSSRGEDPLFLDSAWVLQICRGVILWLLTWALAAPVAAFYETPILAELLPVAGLVALFQGFNSTNLALVNRTLTLGRLTLIELGSAAAGLAVLIGLALVWGSVWSLVIGSLVAPFLLMVLSHVALPGPRNHLRFDKSAGRALVKFGKYIFLSTFAGFLIAQADKAILGKFVSLSDLALYNIAFMFASLPVMVMRKMNDVVLFPLYSRRPPGESAKNFNDIVRARWLVMGTVMAMLGVLALFGNPLIVLLYDTRYEAAGALVVLIAIGSMAFVVIGGYGSMMLAVGDSKRFAILMILGATVQTAFLYAGVYTHGVIGAALAPLVATVIFYPVTVWFLRPYGGWAPTQDIVLAFCGSALAVLSVWINQDLLAASLELFSMPDRGGAER